LTSILSFKRSRMATSDKQIEVLDPSHDRASIAAER
jgi:hypothetical protein